MDTPIPPSAEMPVRRGSLTTVIIGLSLLVVIMVVAFTWWYVGQKYMQNTNSATLLNSSLNAIVATTSVTIPTTSNPLKSATPAVNPVEKTNPFNHAYQNPFQ